MEVQSQFYQALDKDYNYYVEQESTCKVVNESYPDNLIKFSINHKEFYK
jgi:hypothetical protein